jgi:hypothetical protein
VERPRRISRGPFELPVEVRFARDLGLGDVRNCWRADYQRTLERGVELVTTLRVHLVWQWVPKGSSTPMDVMEIGAYLRRYSGRSDPPDNPDDALFAPDVLRQIGAETLVPDTRDLRGAWDLQDGQVVARIRAAVVAELQRRQRDIYARVRDGIRGSGPLHDAARRVTGIRDLLEAYIAVGLADAAAADDRLHALRLIAEDAASAAPGAAAPDRRISTIYARAATAEDTPATNVRTMLAGEATRVDALQAALRDVLGGAPAGASGVAAATSDTAGRSAAQGSDDRGTLPIVRATLTRLAATDAVIRGYPTTRQSRRSPARQLRAALKLR